MKKMNLYICLLMAALCLFSCGKTGGEEQEGGAPAAPAGLTLHDATETSLTFQWNVVSGATSYAWTLTLAGNEAQSGTATARNVKVEGLAKATDYRFGVKAVNAEGESAYIWLDARTAGEITPDPGPKPSTVTYEDFAIPSYEEDGVARAFPGAEGGGMFTTGGRGGKVIHVTNLNDKGEGSLRAAIETKGARIIVFDVAGLIELQSALNIKNGDVTIAGQTAPGDGICLKNYTLHIRTSNVIIRYIRCRMGDEKASENDAMNLNADDNVQNVIIDHCSLSWSTDECGSFYGMTDFTLQWSILSESLRNSIHGKGTHGYGGLWGGSNASYHHNLLAHHDSRNPRLDHDYLSLLKGPVTLVNNVIYNWGDNGTYGGESANDSNDYRKYNLINNYYKPGPATTSGKVRFIDPWTKDCTNCTGKTGSSTIVPGHYYMDGNFMDDSSEKAAGMNDDNWKGTTANAETVALIKSASRFTYPQQATYVSVQSAQDGYSAVLSYVGASLKRDSVDERVVKDTRTRTYTCTGSKGSQNGFIDTQSDAGGWPAYSGTDIIDTDRDGIPDSYEDAWGLDKTNANDGAAVTLDKYGRYSNLEMYLHYLVKDIVTGQGTAASYTNL